MFNRAVDSPLSQVFHIPSRAPQPTKYRYAYDALCVWCWAYIYRGGGGGGCTKCNRGGGDFSLTLKIKKGEGHPRPSSRGVIYGGGGTGGGGEIKELFFHRIDRDRFILGRNSQIALLACSVMLAFQNHIVPRRSFVPFKRAENCRFFTASPSKKVFFP